MNQKQDSDVITESEKPNTLQTLHTVTPLSKYLAMVLFIILPFLGGWIGYNLAPEKVVEVETHVLEDGSSQQEIVRVENNYNNADVFVMNETETEITFIGLVLPGGQDTCPVDGTCSTIVGGIEVIWGEGWPTEPRGAVDPVINSGDRVEVFAKKINDSTVTIYGNENYYIRVAQDSTEENEVKLNRNEDSAVQANEADAESIAIEYVRNNSDDDMAFNLEFVKEKAGWIKYNVIPVKEETDKAQIYLNAVGDSWEVIAFGTAFPGLEERNPEFFDDETQKEFSIVSGACGTLRFRENLGNTFEEALDVLERRYFEKWEQWGNDRGLHLEIYGEISVEEFRESSEKFQSIIILDENGGIAQSVVDVIDSRGNLYSIEWCPD